MTEQWIPEDQWLRPVSAKIRRHGPYTVVEVKGKRITGLGVAKRNPIDKDDRELGIQLALARALREYADNVEKDIAPRG